MKRDWGEIISCLNENQKKLSMRAASSLAIGDIFYAR